MEFVERFHVGIQGTGADPAIPGDREASRIPRFRALREANVTDDPVQQSPPCIVGATRLQYDSGDISESYSADRIGSGQPVRKPFQYDGALWICTSITGSSLTASGNAEHEAYRLIPKRMFSGTPTTYAARTDTFEAAEAARNDRDGFYHGVTVRHGHETLVLCGPPLRFVGEEVWEPLQLDLF